MAMVNVSGLPSGMVSDSPPPKAECIICGKLNITSVGVKVKRACGPCMKSTPSTHHICVHPLHEGARVILNEWFHFSFNPRGVKKFSSYCRSCISRDAILRRKAQKGL